MRHFPTVAYQNVTEGAAKPAMHVHSLNNAQILITVHAHQCASPYLWQMCIHSNTPYCVWAQYV